MTKNIELHLHKWSKMKGALGSVTETGSGGGFSGGSYSSWGGPAMSSYSGIGGSGSQGFSNRIKSLVEITEKAKRAINELDVDGAIGNLHFHDDHVTAISLQSKLTALETYAGKVQQYLKDKIDQPFYEKLDKVGDRLEALNISDYKTSNQIGFKKTEIIYSDAGQYMGTREVLAKEVGLKELYQVDNPYKTRLQAMYEAYKSSDDYRESKLTEEDYLFASHQTRAFTYHSLNDEKAAFEGKRDLLLAAGVVILSIFCPPAGAVAGVALAAADMYSAASGKDWMTGRELDDGERLMRGAFALFDLVPGVGYLNDLAKTGKVAGFAGIKASLKTSFKEGMEQAAKNVDNFKVVLKNVDDFRKQLITKVDDWGRQTTDLLRSVRDDAYQLADGIFNPDFGKHNATVIMPGSQIDEGLEASKRFTLNGGGGSSEIDKILPNPTEELNILRKKWGVPETDTIAIGKTDVPGLEGIIFEGGSPKVRKEAGLPDLDEVMPDREIKSSGKVPSATRHAEEDIANKFVEAVNKLGLNPEDIEGTLRLHQSNPKGVCPTCLSGLGNPDKSSGVIKQLSEMYPKLEIKVTSEVIDGVKPNGRAEFIVKNGIYVN
ncbi:pre-toxin TG domain-containing protein [Streptococcus pluranimalium]|uniref:pre-toxin TG domain-containing protein n=1 Tax=Streptococcus pluranimalium TaxID=82348 RepID=UPI0039FD5D0F